MGTSTSNSGPKDKPPLLPPWAVPSDTDDGEDPAPDEQPIDDDGQPQSDHEIETSTVWKVAKTLMAHFGTEGNSRSLAHAGRAYAGAKGGRAAASEAASSGKEAVARIGRFLSVAALFGMHTALQEVGLGHLIGQSAQSVLAAVLDVLAPSGAASEEAVARKTVSIMLERLYEQHITESGDLSALDSLSSEVVADMIEQCIATYIYILWLYELGSRVEAQAVSSSKAVELERQVKDYVRAGVRLELAGEDPITVDWRSPAGRRIIDTVFREAYGFLEVGL